MLGATVRVAARGAGRERLATIAEWLEAECGRLGVAFERGREIAADDMTTFDGEVVLCTGSRPGRRSYDVDSDATVRTAAAVLAGASLPEGAVAVWDPIGGPIGISVAETLRERARRSSGDVRPHRGQRVVAQW